MRSLQLVPSFIHTGYVQDLGFGVKYGHFGGIGEVQKLYWDQIMIDNVFGELELDYSWKRSYVLSFLGDTASCLLRVEADDEDDITDNQRSAYLAFDKEKSELMKKVEMSILDYYLKNCDGFRQRFEGENKDVCAPYISTVDQLRGLVNLNHIAFLYSPNDNERKVGLVFDAKFDPELGV